MDNNTYYLTDIDVMIEKEIILNKIIINGYKQVKRIKRDIKISFRVIFKGKLDRNNSIKLLRNIKDNFKKLDHTYHSIKNTKEHLKEILEG